MTGCATPGCVRPPAWPSVRRSLTWCQPCLTDLAAARGYVPLEPLGGPKERWLLRHEACGRTRHSNLAAVRKSEPVCPHCRWTAWAQTTRAAVVPAYRSAISRALAAGDLRAAREYAAAYLRAYVWPAERTSELFGAAGARLLETPVDGDGLDPYPWECVACGYRDAHPPERMRLETKGSWLVCRSCDQQRLHHTPGVVAAWFANRNLRVVGEPQPGRDTVQQVECTRCGRPRQASVTQLAGGAVPCAACDGQRLDASAPHRVYLFAFPHLMAYKVGITHCVDDARLAAHARAGGELLDIVEVPDRMAAFLMERRVLDRYAPWPAEVTADHFPHGGWTECWQMTAGRPALSEEPAGL